MKISARTDANIVVPAAQLERLCLGALRAGVAVDDAAYCLALVARDDGSDAAVDEGPASRRVALFTLGRFSLLVEGHVPCVFHAKSPQKPIELLQALLALGGREVQVQQLILAVWPGERSADPRNLLDNTLHRLRHLLGGDDAIVLHHGKLTVDVAVCWVDAWAFERLVGAAQSATPPAHAAEQALQLYLGDFLAHEAPRPWTQAYRDRLHGSFLQLVGTHAARLDAAGCWAAAVACCERGLAIDPLAEALYLQLMAGHMRRGAAADALRVYARCRMHLAHGLGVAPSDAVERLRRHVAPAHAAP